MMSSITSKILKLLPLKSLVTTFSTPSQSCSVVEERGVGGEELFRVFPSIPCCLANSASTVYQVYVCMQSRILLVVFQLDYVQYRQCLHQKHSE